MTDKRMTVSEAIAEIQQERTNWQLLHSVIGQFATPQLQFRQCCIELQDMEYKLARAELIDKRTKLEITKLEATGDPIDAVEAEMKKLELKLHDLAVLGAKREVEMLRFIFSQIPHFTLAEIDAAQPTEYQLRGIQIEDHTQEQRILTVVNND